jgi:hypothetical protein
MQIFRSSWSPRPRPVWARGCTSTRTPKPSSSGAVGRHSRLARRNFVAMPGRSLWLPRIRFSVGSFCLGTLADSFDANEVASGRRAASRVGREDGVVVVTDGSGVRTTGAGTAAVTSVRGQTAAATPEPRTPIRTRGPATRATRTTSRGCTARRGRACNARRGRGPAKLALPRVARPKRYLRREFRQHSSRFPSYLSAVWTEMSPRLF